jgi:hypothetical protein
MERRLTFFATFRHSLSPILVQMPARYLGNEFGAVHKPWDSADVRFALTYPEIYEVGASNLGHIILYSIINGSEGLLCDRAYFPGPSVPSICPSIDPSACMGADRAAAFRSVRLSLSLSGCRLVHDVLVCDVVPFTRRRRLIGAAGAPREAAVRRGVAPAALRVRRTRLLARLRARRHKRGPPAAGCRSPFEMPCILWRIRAEAFSSQSSP